jgi:chromosome partitioning protein
MFDFFNKGKPRQPKPTAALKRLVKDWNEVTPENTELDLGDKLILPMLKILGFEGKDIKNNPSINSPGSVLRPDYLCFRDGLPALVIEIKRRSITLGKAKAEKFTEACNNSALYRGAIGHEVPENGICQYLDATLVDPQYLAPYGLICNGDFFQLWRRVDGLVIPAMPVQQLTAKSLPRLVMELKKCLDAPPSALIAALWNRKGGTGKTTNTINIAATLAKEGKRVLLVDFDPQGDLARGIGLSQLSKKSYFDAVSRKIAIEDHEAAKTLLRTEIQSKEFLCSGFEPFTLSLLATNKDHLAEFRDDSTAQKLEVLFAQMVQLMKADFDYIFVDAAPAEDSLAISLLYAADVVLTPIDGPSAVNHAADIDRDLIPKIQRQRAEKHLPYGPLRLGVVKSNWAVSENSGLEASLANEMKKLGFRGKCYESILRRYDLTGVAYIKSVPIVCNPGTPAAISFKAVTKEVFLNHNFIDR